MSAWQFPEIITQSCDGFNGGYTYVEIATQDTSTYPLVAPVWTTPTQLDSPLIVSSVTIEGSPEAGALGIGSITLECGNEVIHSSGDRIYDIVRGVGNTGTFDIDTTSLHVRLWHKKPGGTYKVRFWGVIDFTSISVTMGHFNDQDTWTVKINADDCLVQFEQAETLGFVETSLLHSTYDKTATTTFLTFIGSYAFSGTTYYPGRYHFINFKYDDGVTNDWISRKLQTPQRDITSGALPIVWFKLTDIFAALSVHFGLDGAVNDGVSWADRHGWRFYYNTSDSTGTGGTALGQVDIDGLYIISALYPIWDGSVNVYAQAQTLFDRDSGGINNPASFMKERTAYDLLKRICISLGCAASIRVNASGQRYLDIRDAAVPSAIMDYGVDDMYEVDAEIKPYTSSITGVEVVSPFGDNVIRGSNGNGSKKIDTSFTVCNFARQDHDWRRSISMNSSAGGAEYCTWGSNGKLHDMFCALWTLTGPTSATNFTNAYSICAIAARMNFKRSPDVAFIAGVPDGSTSGYTYGKFQTVFGGLGIDNVMYPSNTGATVILPTVPAMALSHFFYSPQQMGLPSVGHQVSYDDVGLYRNKGRELRLKRSGIEDDIPYPGSTLEVVIGGVPNTYYVRSVTEDYETNMSEYTLELWGAA